MAFDLVDPNHALLHPGYALHVVRDSGNYVPSRLHTKRKIAKNRACKGSRWSLINPDLDIFWIDLSREFGAVLALVLASWWYRVW